MSNIIAPRRSSTSGAVPTAAQLATGELAMNLADGKFYSKNASGSVVNMGLQLTSTLPVGLAASAAVGSSTTAARSDHAHASDGMKCQRINFSASSNKTYYEYVLGAPLTLAAAVSNIMVCPYSYWTNTGAVTLKVGLWQQGSGVIDDDYFLTAIDLKNTGPALGSIIDFLKPGSYAGIGLQGNNWQNLFSYTTAGSYASPVVSVSVPSGGAQAGTTYVYWTQMYQVSGSSPTSS